MKILVDTSVWLRALGGLEPFKSHLDRLLFQNQVTGHDLIYGELLIGDVGGRSRFLATYLYFDRAAPVSHREVGELVRLRRLHGRGIGWIDAHLLASAMAGRLRFWTADDRLATVAADMGVGYAASP
jgi:predicted nucleic acid-binding protein